MCFSAGASFTAAGLLAVIGAVTTSKAKKSYKMLASIPFLFAIQQVTEGFLWLSFVHTGLMRYQSYFAYGFLFFAFMLWPIWMPLSLYVVERIRSKKTMLFGCFCVGALLSLGLFFNFFFYGAQATIIDHNIVYQIHLSQAYQLLGTILYFIATVIPFFVSSVRLGWLFGISLAASYIMTFYFYYKALVSMWCFFAALLSILLIIIT